MYKDKFIRAFEQGELTCCGTLEGKPCKHAFRVDCTQWTCLEKLASLHVDHGFEVVHICDMWIKALQVQHHDAYARIDAALLMHMLFSLERRHDVMDVYSNRKRQRTSPYYGTEFDKGDHGKVVLLSEANLKFRCKECHNTASAHYTHRLTIDDILERRMR